MSKGRRGEAVCIATRAQAAATLRQRREADALPELIAIWQEWLRTAFPEYADSIAGLPDEMFRTSSAGSVEHDSGFGQDPDEVRRQFMELVEELLETEQEYDREE